MHMASLQADFSW